MKIYPFQAIFPINELIASPDSFFGTSKHKFKDYYQAGFYQKQAKEGFYIYEIFSQSTSYVGLVCCVGTDEIKAGNVKKHENTLAAKEQEMMRLIIEREAFIKPVLLTYESTTDLKKFLTDYIAARDPVYSSYLADTGYTHQFYEVFEGPDIAVITDTFLKQIGSVYIADGHHRCSTQLLLKESAMGKAHPTSFDNLLSVLIDIDQLEIWDYNRIVSALEDISPVELIVKLSKYFKVSPLKKAKKPNRKGEIHMYIEQQWYKLSLRKKQAKKLNASNIQLDTEVFNKLVLMKILKVRDVRIDHRIQYTSGRLPLKEFTKKVDKDPNDIGFMIYPLLKEEFLKVAGDNNILPPKSTWFEPRMLNGIIAKVFG